MVKKSYSNTPLPAVVIGYKIPARYAPDAYPLDLASNILAGGESSRLYQTLVYKEPDRGAIGRLWQFHRGSEPLLGFAIMNQGHTADEGEKAIVGVLDGLKIAACGCERVRKRRRIRKSRDSFSGATRMKRRPSRSKMRAVIWQESRSWSTPNSTAT